LLRGSSPDTPSYAGIAQAARELARCAIDGVSSMVHPKPIQLGNRRKRDPIRHE